MIQLFNHSAKLAKSIMRKKKGGNCFMKNDKLIKIIGIVTTVVGVGVSLVSNWVNDKNLDMKVNEKIAKALADKEN